MRIEIYLSARDGSYNATAIYDDGKVIVNKGSLIRQSFAQHIRGGGKIKRMREDLDIVGVDGITKLDCEFSSPSTAAQFIMGSSVNGWRAWHVDKKTSLKVFAEKWGATSLN